MNNVKSIRIVEKVYKIYYNTSIIIRSYANTINSKSGNSRKTIVRRKFFMAFFLKRKRTEKKNGDRVVTPYFLTTHTQLNSQMFSERNVRKSLGISKKNKK